MIKIILFIILAIMAYWISGIIHELGHVIVGLLNGWKFHLLIVGPIGLKRDKADKLRLYFEKNLLLWAGVGATLPKKREAANINVWKKVLLGGPIVSIIMGVIFLPIGIYSDNLFLIILGAMPLGMGIMCGLPLPLKTGILYTDGGRWARLNGKERGFYEEKSLFTITQSTINSDSFADINFADIDPLIKSDDASIQFYGYYYSYRYFKENGNDEKMNESIKEMNKLKKKVSKVIIEDCKMG